MVPIHQVCVLMACGPHRSRLDSSAQCHTCRRYIRCTKVHISTDEDRSLQAEHNGSLLQVYQTADNVSGCPRLTKERRCYHVVRVTETTHNQACASPFHSLWSSHSTSSPCFHHKRKNQEYHQRPPEKRQHGTIPTQVNNVCKEHTPVNR